MDRGGDVNNDEYELELQVLRPLSVDEEDIQCFSLVGMYSQAGGPNFPEGDPDHCIVFDIPLESQIPVQPNDVVGFYSNSLRTNRNNDGVQLINGMPDVVAFFRERANIPSPSISSCSFIAGANNVDTSTTAAPVITVVVGKLLVQNVHQQVPFCTIYIQWADP